MGDPVVAIGNPLGETRTITSGIVSAVNRSIDSPADDPIENAIQTDAAINHGNSGGPLIDAEGKVIGITSQILTGSNSEEAGSIGIGFAIPIDTARTVADQIIATRSRLAPVRRRQGRRPDPRAGLRRCTSRPQHGFLVEEVTPNSPAANAGITGGTTTATISGTAFKLGGDVITAVDGKQINVVQRSVQRHRRPQVGRSDATDRDPRRPEQDRARSRSQIAPPASPPFHRYRPASRRPPSLMGPAEVWTSKPRALRGSPAGAPPHLPMGPRHLLSGRQVEGD